MIGDIVTSLGYTAMVFIGCAALAVFMDGFTGSYDEIPRDEEE